MAPPKITNLAITSANALRLDFSEELEQTTAEIHQTTKLLALDRHLRLHLAPIIKV
jgi:hypothetical protein